jgi:xanthine dehydrogenase small subunit
VETIRLRINGQAREERALAPTTTLLRYLRDHAGLSGTKEGCAEGDCGACTVVVADRRADGAPTFRAVNSCLVLLPMLQGRDVWTVEGLAEPGRPHAVQEALARHLGSQCGYCTPGVVMSMCEAAYRTDMAEPWQVDDQMCGNLCRCTGYRPIREATAEVAGRCGGDAFSRGLASEPGGAGLAFEHGGQRYFNPTSLAGLFDVLALHPGARLVSGGTDLSLEVTKRFQAPPLLVSVEHVPELRRIERTAEGFRVGAAATLTELQEALGLAVPPVEKMLRVFASRQIRNRATVGGNLCTASPIGDLAPVLMALGARVNLASRGGNRSLPLDEFFVSYRKTALRPGEVLASVDIPLVPAGVRASSFKVSKRRELDISAVSAGMWVRVGGDGRVEEARLAYGGVAATPARARATEAALVGLPWSEASVRDAMPLVDRDFTPISDHRGSAWYRAQVAKNLLLGFFLETQAGLAGLDPRPTATVQLKVS